MSPGEQSGSVTVSEELVSDADYVQLWRLVRLWDWAHMGASSSPTVGSASRRASGLEDDPSRGHI